MNICIIGAGAYGCYTADTILNAFPTASITILEVGDARARNESEIGFSSILRKRKYRGLSFGRYFGFGGTTEKWGGQLLLLTKNDFKNPNSFLRDVVYLNEKYKKHILDKFNFKINSKEKFVSDSLFIKTGVWLSVLNRNFFRLFKIGKRRNISIISNARVSRLALKDRKISEVYYLKDGREYSFCCDYYFLTAGAFETARILLSSGCIDVNRVYFSDHLSQKLLKIKKSTIIGDDDFAFKLKNLSLITKRLVGEYNGISFYIHPVFNMDFPFFKVLKRTLFQKSFSFNDFFILLNSIPEAIVFLTSILVHKRVYVHKSEWYFYVDFDNPTMNSFVELSNNIDRFGINALNVTYNIGDEASGVFEFARQEIINYLRKEKIDFHEESTQMDSDNIEDIYHPHRMFEYSDISDYFNHFDNMLVVNTGVLPRSGGINPTAALFPVIEEFVRHRLYAKVENFN